MINLKENVIDMKKYKKNKIKQEVRDLYEELPFSNSELSLIASIIEKESVSVTSDIDCEIIKFKRDREEG